MPDQTKFLRQSKLFLIYVLLLCVLVTGLGYVMITSQTKILNHEEGRQTNLEMTLINEFLQDSLIRHDYAETRDFLLNWAKTRANVQSLKASFSNGLTLVDYHSEDEDSRTGVTVTQDILFGENVLTLEITRDAKFVDNIISQFKTELLLEALFIVFFIGTSLWFILSRYTITPMQKALLMRSEALAASEQLYRSVAANIPNGAVMIFSKRMKCLFADGIGLYDLGYTSDDVVGENPDVIFAGPSLFAVEELIKDALRGEHADNDDIKIKDKYLWVQAAPLRTEDSRIEKILLLTQEITERKKLMKDLIEAREQAESANRAKSEFLANMSHEIRTPMNAIMGYAELLKTERDEKYKIDYLKGISTAGKNLLNIINDILDLSKIEAGKLVVSYEPISIKDLVKDTVAMFLVNAKAKNLALSAKIPDDLPPFVFMDETRLQQILINLVGNAIKFTKDGYVNISIDYTAHDDDLISLKINIEDTGLGIRDEQIDKIFDSFTQQDGQDTRKFGGTGLGLSITKKLTEILSGEIKVKSRYGEGTVFTVSFDNLKVAKYDKKEKHMIPPPNIDFEPATVLVVDDVESNRNIIRNFLKDFSVTVIEAENGREGVELAINLKPNIVLMDVQMPVMDGYEATRIIKTTDSTKHIPIVAVTASVYGNSEKVKRTMDGYLSKPYTKAELVIELAQFLPYKTMTTDKEIPQEAKAVCLNDLSAEEKRLINEKFSGRFEEVTSLMINQDISDFAEELIVFCEENSIDLMKNFAEELKELTDSFKIEEMETALLELKTKCFK